MQPNKAQPTPAAVDVIEHAISPYLVRDQSRELARIAAEALAAAGLLVSASKKETAQ